MIDICTFKQKTLLMWLSCKLVFDIQLWFSLNCCLAVTLSPLCVATVPGGDLIAVLSLGLKYEYVFISTCGFLLTMWLLQVWIYKPLHTPLLCGRKAELKIGRFGGSEQPASLCAVLKNTQDYWHCVCISFIRVNNHTECWNQLLSLLLWNSPNHLV